MEGCERCDSMKRREEKKITGRVTWLDAWLLQPQKDWWIKKIGRGACLIDATCLFLDDNENDHSLTMIEEKAR